MSDGALCETCGDSWYVRESAWSDALGMECSWITTCPDCWYPPATPTPGASEE